MKLLLRIKRKYRYLRNKIFIYIQKKKVSYDLHKIDPNRPTLFYVCLPIHSNLGDQAQLMCIQKWIKTFYPNYHVASMCSRALPTNYYHKVLKLIKPNDIILVHSGYLFMNDPSDVPAILKLVDTFKNNKTIIMPQTINFSSKSIRESFVKVFNKHHNLTLLCRDFISYEKAKELFPNVNSVAYPDIVTSLIGSFTKKNMRSGVCFCLRNDKEKFYSDEELDSLISKLGQYGYSRIDTTLNISPFKMNSHREKFIYNMIDKISHYQVVITDRYHGTILSLIANTPVIIIQSTDHKLSSGVDWFPHDIFSEAIYYAKDLSEAYTIAVKVISRDLQIENPPYFRDKYWSRMIE